MSEEARDWVFAQALSIFTGLYSAKVVLDTLDGIMEIHMSPELLKALSLISKRHVSTYEEMYGPITVDRALILRLGYEED